LKFGFGKTATEFDERSEQIRKATEALYENLTLLKNAAGADASQVLLFHPGGARLGTLTDVVGTLMACVDALSARVAILENQ
jgi:hypothetical protein